MNKSLEVTFSDSRILISIPHSVLKTAAPYAFDQAFGEEHNLRISNQKEFAKGVFQQLLDEDEEGTTVVHRMLDKAMCEVVEQGGEGVTERKTKAPID